MDTVGYEVLRTSTETMTPVDRAEFWVDHVRANHGLLDARFGGVRAGFRGGTIRQRGGGHQLVEFWSDGIAYARTARQISRNPDGVARLVLPVRGRLAIRTAQGETWLVRGEGGVLPVGAPFVLGHDDDARGLVLSLPGASLPAQLRTRLDLRTGLGAVLGGMVGLLATQRDVLDAGAFGTLCAQIDELLAQVATEQPPTTRLEVVERTFRDHVEAHADDSALTGATAAAALGWSLRQVQVALQRGGTTPREVIRDARLRRARRRLGDPGLAHLGVTDIALMSGFRSLRTFNDAFRGRYGTPPSAARDLAA